MVGPIGSSPTAIPDSGQFRALLNSFFARDTETRKQHLWDTFLLAHGYTINPLDSDSNAIALWGTFLNTAHKKLVPTTGFYKDAIDDYLGTDLSTAKKQELWERFLDRINYAFNPAPTDQSAQVEFIKFMQYIVEESVRVEGSPQEAIKRSVLLDTFGLIISLLAILQNTVKVHSDSLTFYTKMQETITKLMSKVPVYTQDKPHAWTENTTHLDQWTVGYPNLSIADITDYIARQYKLGASATIILDSYSIFGIPGTPTVGSYVKFSTGPPFPFVEIGFVDTSGTPFLDVPGGSVSYIASWQGTATSFLDIATETEVSKAFQQAFLTIYNPTLPLLPDLPLAAYAFSTFMPTVNQIINPNLIQTLTTGQDAVTLGFQTTGLKPGIAQPYTGSANAGVRGEANTRMQQYLEGLRSQRDIWKNRQKVIEGQLDRDKESVSQLTNFIASFADTLKNLLAAIFR